MLALPSFTITPDTIHIIKELPIPREVFDWYPLATGDKWIYKHDDNNEPVLLKFNDVPDYYKKTGANTSYVIHPEEILAENFVLLVQGIQTVQSPGAIETISQILKTNSILKADTQKN